MVLRDTPGAARSIVETLVKNKVNILVQEGLSDYGDGGQSAHNVYMVLDLRGYYTDIDGNTHHRNSVEKPSVKPNQLIMNLLTNAFNYLQTTPSEDGWNFTFSRMDFFYRHKEHRTKAESTHLLSEKRTIVVPDQIVHNIFNGSPPESLACHILSDTEEKYIKVRFLREGTQSLLLRIAHREQVGAILNFMNVLKRYDANITNSYSRLASMSKIAIWYAFVEIPPKFDESELRKMLSDFDTLDDVESFTVRSHYGIPFDPQESARHFSLRRYEERHQVVEAESSAVARVDQARRETLRTIEEYLEVRPYYLDSEWVRQPKTVFVAMPFDDQYEEFYRDHIWDTIESCGLRSIRLDKEDALDPSVPLTELIRRAIATCDFVVADLTHYNPNVIYEVGLAHAIGKRVVFICEERYQEERGPVFDLQNYRHVLYSPYKLKTFDDKFRKCIVAMRDFPDANHADQHPG